MDFSEDDLLLFDEAVEEADGDEKTEEGGARAAAGLRSARVSIGEWFWLRWGRR